MRMMSVFGHIDRWFCYRVIGTDSGHFVNMLNLRLHFVIRESNHENNSSVRR